MLKVMESAFRHSLGFFDRLGIFDVVLPFLLVFTIVFAILEKSKILGTEQVGEEKVTRKNLNAMISFVIALFVVASTKLVATISVFLSNIVLMIIVIMGFLLLGATFHSGEKEFSLEGGWQKLFMIISFIAVIIIFLYSMGWLDKIFDWIVGGWDSSVVASIILLIIIIIGIYYVVKGPKKETKGEETS